MATKEGGGGGKWASVPPLPPPKKAIFFPPFSLVQLGACVPDFDSVPICGGEESLSGDEHFWSFAESCYGCDFIHLLPPIWHQSFSSEPYNPPPVQHLTASWNVLYFVLIREVFYTCMNGAGGVVQPIRFGKRAHLTGPLISYVELWCQQRRNFF